ncbi:hypothetical protein VSH64_28075 [Amycolatopsis rhabdoformis]|uniref:DUF1963 domain-containing protein n=1 Tax=Amycolatopsis rhabdoformis TaxID=1448059 RepID=A0ABZ1HYN6_9PSEU|nr:hypothetical protein [Amycolatopsis rhabdoformis]WSE26736.1 hypothetical protein VSH64_28075 [Amycolatopsis rhabdoformis]
MNLPTANGVPLTALAPYARTTVRLHPAAGEPTARESHVGGPLLWPAGESWPTCPVTWPPQVEATDDGWTGGHPDDEPVPSMIGAAQFFKEDFPELPFPEGTDVAQVLLCPTHHEGRHVFGPAIRVVWRDSAAVTDLAEVPEPPEVADDELLPEPRTLRPCRFDEFPGLDEFSKEQRTELDLPALRDDVEYELGQFSKIAGWTAWYAGSPWELDCRECGARLQQAIALATQEDEMPCGCDVEDDEEAGWEIGRQGSLNVFLCPTDPTHPVKVRIE